MAVYYGACLYNIVMWRAVKILFCTLCSRVATLSSGLMLASHTAARRQRPIRAAAAWRWRENTGVKRELKSMSCWSHQRMISSCCLVFMHSVHNCILEILEILDICWSLILWCPLLPYGYSYKASCAIISYVISRHFICNFWHPGTLTLKGWASECLDAAA